jgi:hypothetical protein
MTTPDPNFVPAAGEALRLAFDIVKTPCSSAESARAEILLGIAREIRQAADMRVSVARRRELDASRYRLAVGELASGGIIPKSAAPTFVGEHEPERDVAQAPPAEADVTAYMPAFAEQTQHLPIVWSIGDRADCRHCHTPIVFVARRMKDPVREDEGDFSTLWVHKYTDNRTCVDSSIDDGHTFAEPVSRV